MAVHDDHCHAGAIVKEFADRLNAIYLYSRRTLGEARVERSPEKIEHVQGLIKDIRDSWAQICGGEVEV